MGKKAYTALVSEDGTLLSDHSEIRKRAVRFWEELYRSEISYEQALDKVFLEILPQVSKEANADLGRALALEESDRALESMEGGKAPGTDSLAVDFYKSFWTEMLAVLSDSLARGWLPLTCQKEQI